MIVRWHKNLVIPFLWALVLLLSSASAMAATVSSPLINSPSAVEFRWTPHVTVDGKSVTVQWSSATVPGGEELRGYHVFRSTLRDDLLNPKCRLTDFAVKQNSLTDVIEPGLYYYIVQAVFANGRSMASAVVEVDTSVSPLTSGTPALPPLPGDSSGHLDGLIADTYLGVAGIAGSIGSGTFAGYSSVMSFEWEGSHGDAGTTPRLGNLIVTKPADASSVQLAVANLTQKHLPTVALIALTGSGPESPQITHRIVLLNARVARYSAADEGDDGTLVEQIEFSYERMAVQNRERATTSVPLPRWVTVMFDPQSVISAPPPMSRSLALLQNTSATLDGASTPQGDYLMISGVPGPTTIGSLVGAASLLSYRLDTAPSSNAEVPRIPLLTVIKERDVTSPYLISACVSGETISCAVLEDVRPNKVFYRAVLTGVRVSAFKTDGHVERVTLACDGIQ
ncbi:MAG: type VI secretion system tube protein Hcp, partial [Bacillota bacterium]